ncbi:MAG TPA: hypothetical protein DDY79_16005 [Brevundimonas sp.]|nr:hypothetical protein [Brevundimonas sp.]
MEGLELLAGDLRSIFLFDALSLWYGGQPVSDGIGSRLLEAPLALCPTHRLDECGGSALREFSVP